MHVIEEYLSRESRRFLQVLGIVAVIMLGLIHYLTGASPFVMFYMAPIAFVTWFAGPRAGGLVLAVAALVYLAVEGSGGGAHLSFATFWHPASELAVMLLVTLLVAQLKSVWEQEKQLERIDQATGALLEGYFVELASQEILRAQRYAHPFTLVCIEFCPAGKPESKAEIELSQACLLVQAIRQHVRETDLLARLIGGRFAVLMPETGEETAGIVLGKVQKQLTDLVRRQSWPVIIKISAVTYLTPPASVDEMLSRAKIGSRQTGIKHEVVGAPGGTGSIPAAVGQPKKKAVPGADRASSSAKSRSTFAGEK